MRYDVKGAGPLISLDVTLCTPLPAPLPLLPRYDMINDLDEVMDD
jgi:hypothetical protein